jgi:uncharacterized RDD family membrane protein YckC/Tol biopolymer transport system component
MSERIGEEGPLASAQRSNEQKTLPVEMASLWRRLLAFNIDAIILSLADGFISWLGGVEGMPTWWATVWGVVGIVISVLYYVWPYSTSGQTIGKAIFGIRVIAIDGSPLNWRKGILRWLGYIPSSIPLGLGFLWSIWDADKQAWHDKIAGTCVVRASVMREQLQGTIDPSEARRRQRRWLLGLGIPTLLIVAVGGAWFWSSVQGSMAEVTEMGSWPAREVSTEQAVTVDLSHLGLKMGEIQSARDEEMWKQGLYGEGSLVTYYWGEKAVVSIWGLRYNDKETAGNDFASAVAWAEENCGGHTSAHLGTTGVIHCGWSDAYGKIFWKDYWIVEIVALEGTEFTPAALVDKVRDAIATRFVCISTAACGPTPMAMPPTDTLPPGLSERLVVQIDFSSWIQEHFTVSPDSRRVAYVAQLGDKVFVVVDGKEGKPYDGIAEGTPIFSPDSRRVAYAAQLGDKQFVVVDGKEEKQYDGILEGGLIFSPDSQRVAYAAQVGDKWFVVVDGKEEKQYDGILEGTPIFSPDSQRVAYAAFVGNKVFVIMDGKEEKPYDGIGAGSLLFSPDSQRVAYVAVAGDKWLVVVDGKEGKPYDGILEDGLIFSPDSQRVAYAAQVGDKWFVVMDGKEEKPYDVIEDLIFSPDSQQVAYVARVGDRWFAVVDGKEGKQYDGIVAFPPIFSPDSQRVAYAAVAGDEQFVVVDGKEEKPYDAIGVGSLIFSPDSQRVAYVTRVGDKWFVVIDRQEGKKCDGIADLALPSSVRTASEWLMGLKWGTSGLWSWMDKRRSNTISSGQALSSSVRTASGWLMSSLWS